MSTAVAEHQHPEGYDASAQEWHGPAVDPQHLREFLGHFLIDQLNAQPDDNIVQLNHDSGYEMSAAELRAKSLKVADRLAASGLRLRWGDRVCVAADHHDDLAALVIGALLRGVVVNALHTGFTMLEFKHFIGLVQPKVIFCEAHNVATIREALQELQQTATLVSLDDNPEDTDAAVDHHLRDLVRGWDTEPTTEVPQPSGLPSQQLAFIACSSGTTGLPKGICVTHSMCLLGMARAWPCGRHQYILNTSALYWGTYLLGLCNLQYGCKRVFTTRTPITIDHLLDILEQRRIAAVFIAGPVIIGLLAALRAQPLRRLPHLRQIQATGSTIPAHAYSSLAELLPGCRLNIAYGMSDVGGGIAISGTQDYDANGEELPRLPALVQGSSGRVAHGTTVRVVAEGSGERCGPGQLGEMLVRKVIPFPGYLNNEVTNREAFDEEGFLRTGDIGRIDEDGQLYVVDRRKDFFKYRGFQIAPSELEHFIEGRFPGQVQTAVVVGIEDDEVMSWPAAVIVRRRGAELAAEDVQRAVEADFSDAKRLRGGVYFVDVLPRTSSNKVRRNVVQQMAAKLWAERGAVVEE